METTASKALETASVNIDQFKGLNDFSLCD